MNKNKHRIVFNKNRGQMMAVAETAGAHSKAGSGQTTLTTIVIGLLLGGALSFSATAQIKADTTAPGAQQPQILSTANGITQVNIQAPSAAGVSRNVYSQFDVNAQGAILNNSRTNVQTQLGGWVQGNSNLAAGSARVILNEVNSSNPSYLRGFVEVAGQRAEVIIANPSGISVNGGGFINASGVTLTTGTAQINPSNGGSLDNYRVQQGTITIEGAGLDTRTADFTNILARAVQVNAGIWAKDLRVVTGANDVNASTTAATPIVGIGATPAFAVDVSALGGMYANKIFLIGTEAGVGVNNAGTIAANGGDLVLSVNGILTNRGTLDADNATNSSRNSITAATVNNIGTGAIFGDHISIGATTLNNQAENVNGTVKGATIGARNSLNIGVTTLNNSDMGLDTPGDPVNNITATPSVNILSLGDLAIGGSLDAAGHAQGRAASINNTSATIQAAGNITLGATAINNTDAHFAYVIQPPTTTAISETIGSAASGYYANITSQTVSGPVLTAALPGTISAAGNLTIDADTVNNANSRLLAGGNVAIPAAVVVDNAGITAVRSTTKNGTSYTLLQDRSCQVLVKGNCLAWGPWYDYWQSAGYSSTVAGSVTVGAGAATSHASASNPGVPGTSVPSSSLYQINNSPTATYVVATNPAFTNYRTWLGSDYMLRSLTLDTSVTQKRLGDGFYEQRLLNEQVAQLTGLRFLANYTSDDQQYRALMDAGVTFAQTFNLRPGIALTAAQIAQLTSDIVWLQQETVNLPDGTKTVALVPQVYLSPRASDLSPSGGLMSGATVNITTSGDTINSGTILGRKVVQLNAANVQNLAGNIRADAVGLNATQDINNIGGSVTAKDALAANAGRDINSNSTTISTSTNTTVDRLAGLYVTGDAGVLLASAGRDITLLASVISNAGTDSTPGGTAGSTRLVAARDITLGTVATSQTNNTDFSADTFRHAKTTAEVGSTINAAGNVQLQAGSNINARAAQMAAVGDVDLKAAGNVAITAGQSTSSTDLKQSVSNSGTLVSSTMDSRKQTSGTQTIASNVSGNNVTITSGNNIGVKGSNLTAAQDVAMVAGNDVVIESAQNTSASASFRRETNSGLSVTDMGAINVGHSEQAQEGTLQSTTQVASTVNGANVKVQAGRDATVKASNLLADQNITVAAARDINILAAANTQSSTSRSESTSTTHGLMGDFTGRLTILGTTASLQDGSQTAVSQSTSVLSANQGKLTLAAANTLLESAPPAAGGVSSPSPTPNTTGTVTTQGAELLAGQTVTITGAAVDLQAINDATSSLSHTESKTVTLGARAAGILAMPGAIADNIALSQNTKNSRLKDAAALKAGYDAYKMVSPTEAAPDATSGAGDAGSASQGIGVSVNLDSGSTSSDSAAKKSVSRGTNVQAKDIVVKAMQGDITATAAKLQAQNITLEAAKNINLIAAANLETNNSSNNSNSAGVGVTFAVGGSQEGFSIQLRAAQAQGRANGTETTYDNTQVTATKNLTVKSGTDTNLIGAQLAGETVKMDVGTSGKGKLNIETLQNTSTFTSSQTSSGFDMSLCIPPICYGTMAEFKLALAQQAIDHNYRSAVGQSGIAAGKGGFDIAVAGNTDLKGAAITSSADASKNKLATKSLTSSDLTNVQSTSSSSSSITVGNSASMAKTALTNVLANLALQDGLPANGNQSSKTLSVISPATVTITGSGNANTDAASDQQVALLTSRDASTANKTLTNTLTLQQAIGLQAKQQEAQENARAAQMVGDVATSVVNDIATSQQRQLQAAENQRAKAANEKPAVIAAWGEGSTQKIALNALAGFVQASAAGKDGLTGAANVLVMAAAAKGAQQIGDWATATDTKPAQIDAFVQAMSHAVLGCAVGSATAGNGSGCTPGAVGAVVGELAAKFYNSDGKGNKANTLAFAQTMATLAGALVANGTGDNVGQASTIAAATGGNSAANNFMQHLPKFKANADACKGNPTSVGCADYAAMTNGTPKAMPKVSGYDVTATIGADGKAVSYIVGTGDNAMVMQPTDYAAFTKMPESQQQQLMTQFTQGQLNSVSTGNSGFNFQEQASNLRLTVSCPAGDCNVIQAGMQGVAGTVASVAGAVKEGALALVDLAGKSSAIQADAELGTNSAKDYKPMSVIGQSINEKGVSATASLVVDGVKQAIPKAIDEASKGNFYGATENLMDVALIVDGTVKVVKVGTGLVTDANTAAKAASAEAAAIERTKIELNARRDDNMTTGLVPAETVNKVFTDKGYSAPFAEGSMVTVGVSKPGTPANMVVSEGQAAAIADGKPAYGAFSTPDAVPSQQYARENLAITQDMKSDVSMVQPVVTGNTPVVTLEGKIAPQNPASQYSGGGNQTFYDYPVGVPRSDVLKPAGEAQQLPVTAGVNGSLGSAANGIYTDMKPMGTQFPELSGVNPHYVEGAGPGVNTNCVSCVNAAQARLTGANPAVVASPSSGYAGPNALLPSAPFGLQPPSSVAAVAQQMAAAGDGAVGVVLIKQPSGVSHVINVVNQNGQVYFVDAQMGKIVTLQPNLTVQLGMP